MQASGILTVQRIRAGQVVTAGVAFAYSDDAPVPTLTLSADWSAKQQAYKSNESYEVAEFATGAGWDGRGFRLRKPDGTGYDVFISDEPVAQPDRCDCDGFTRWQRCKHTDCLRHLAEVGVIRTAHEELATV